MDLRPPPNPSNYTLLGRQPVPGTGRDRWSAMDDPSATISRYDPIGHELHGEGKDSDRGMTHRGIRELFVIPDRLGRTTRARNKTERTKRTSKGTKTKYQKDESESDASGASLDSDDGTEISDEDVEADVSRLPKTRPLNDLFRKVMSFNRYRLKIRSARYNSQVACRVSS